jgi:MFS family permease
VIFSGASLACGLADSVTFLDTARAVQGLGAALMFATSLAILADAFPEPKQRAGAMAAYGATLGASFAVGPAVGGVLTTGLGWRSVFFVNVPLGLVALVGTFAWLRESRHLRSPKLDWPGQATLAGGLLLLLLALLRGNAAGCASARTLTELAGAGALLLGFVLVEGRVTSPMLPLGFFARRDFTAAQVAAFTISTGFFALYLYLTLYLQDVLGLSPLDAGLATLPGTLLLFMVSGASAPLTQRVAPATLVSVGLTVVAGGVALITIVGAHSSWTALLPGFLLACLGTGIVNPSLGMLALGAGTIDNSGLLAGANDAFRNGGGAVGVAVFGALVPAAAAVGRGPAQAYVTGLHHALLLGAGITAAGAATIVALMRARSAPAATVVPFGAGEAGGDAAGAA